MPKISYEQITCPRLRSACDVAHERAFGGTSNDVGLTVVRSNHNSTSFLGTLRGKSQCVCGKRVEVI
jgi:hypothetical protein